MQVEVVDLQVEVPLSPPNPPYQPVGWSFRYIYKYVFSFFLDVTFTEVAYAIPRLLFWVPLYRAPSMQG